MTPVEPDEQGKTAPIERPTSTPSSSSAPRMPPTPPEPADPAGRADQASRADSPDRAEPLSPVDPIGRADPVPWADPAARPDPVGWGAHETVAVARVAGPPQDVVYVPLAVNVGDGFKFGCGFFLALVLAMLVGFVLIAALFVLTSLFGLNLPISR